MKKSTAVIVTCIFIAGLAAAGFAIRGMIDFNMGAPLYEYMPQDQLVAMIYDLVYFYGWVLIVFVGLSLIMLLYLILMVESLIEEAKAEKAKPKRKRRTAAKKKSWPPPEEPD